MKTKNSINKEAIDKEVFKDDIPKNFKYPLYIVSRGYGQKEIKIKLQSEPLAENETSGQVYCDKINSEKGFEKWFKNYYPEKPERRRQLIEDLLTGNEIVRIASIYTDK